MGNIQVFVSHAHADEHESYDTVANYFEREILDDLGLNSYIRKEDPTSRDLSGGIEEEIRNSEYHIIILTSCSAKSSWVIYEYGYSRGALGSGRGYESNTYDRIMTFTHEELRTSKNKLDSFLDITDFVRWKSETSTKGENGNESVVHANVNLSESESGSSLKSFIKNKLSHRLLEDVFRKESRMYKKIDERDIDKDRYEILLKLFGKWSNRNVEAVSRQPLNYWFSKNGYRYREHLQRQDRDNIEIERINVWNISNLFNISVEDLCSHSKRFLERDIENFAFNPHCSLCILYYLLFVFWFDCHYPSKESGLYIHSGSISEDSPLCLFDELIVYDGEYNLACTVKDEGKKDLSLVKGTAPSITDDALVMYTVFREEVEAIVELKPDHIDISLDGSEFELPIKGTLYQLARNIYRKHDITSCDADLNSWEELEVKRKNYW